jgi:hypothetical protein
LCAAKGVAGLLRRLGRGVRAGPAGQERRGVVPGQRVGAQVASGDLAPGVPLQRARWPGAESPAASS